ELRLYGQQRSAFHPSMADAEVLRESFTVPSRMEKLIGLPESIPLLASKFNVSALHDVIVHAYEKKRGCVGGRVWIWVCLEPIHEIRTLRDLVRHFAVVALELADEVEGFACRAIVTLGIERERSPHGIPSEKPGEPRPLRCSRGPITRHQSRSEIWIFDQSLRDA